MPLTVEHGVAAIATAKSSNAKIGDAAATYVAQVSCPRSCAFYNGGGCYAENGTIYSGLTKPLNGAAAALSLTSLDVAKEEADAIDDLDVAPGRPMRLHTVGDCKTDEAARIVSAAAERYMERGGGPVWTYTHAWAIVERASWGRVSVLASCETLEQVELARARGYATSIVVAEFASRSLYDCRTASVSRGNGNTGSPRSPGRHGASGQPRLMGQRPGSEGAPVTSALILPCPAQTHDDVACSSCRLCMDDGALRRRGYSIGFEVHGTAFTIRQAEKSLRTPGDDTRRLTSRDHALAYLDRHGRFPNAAQLRTLAAVSHASAVEMLARLRVEHTAQGGARV